MKKILLLLILSFFSAQGFAGSCPDGSDPVKSVSADGTYFVYNCGGQSSSSSVTNSNTGTVKVAMKPFSGDWLKESIYPFRLKEEMLSRVASNNAFAMGDFDNDGVDDVFHLGMPAVAGLIQGSDNPEITNSVACDPNSGHPCFHSKPWVSVFSMENNVTHEIWSYEKSKWVTTTGPAATDVSKLLINNNPVEMNGQESNQMALADFNGDGVVDVFVNDGGIQIIVPGKTHAVRPGKNDLYFLSQADGTWLESTSTHVTGTGVLKGKGLIKFTHGKSVGDIDGDGDIDIVVTSSDWVGNNGEILCYVNQGDGHMIVRICGDQFGMEVELGDFDNDGDLDIAFGGNSYASKQEWADVGGMGDCASYNHCPRAFNGILLNDGKGNFFKRGFEFSNPVDSSNGLSYEHVPNISVADLDGDGDLDVVRSLVGRLYHGAAITIEENIGNGQFRTVMIDELCDGPKTKAEWSLHEGNIIYGCWVVNFKFGDFNKDGLIDIVVDGSHLLKKNHTSTVHRVIDGTVYLSTGKLKYDTVYPDDANYPLVDVNIRRPLTNSSTSALEDELAEFEAQLEEELAAEAADAIAKRKAKVAAAKAKRIAEEEAAKAAETNTVDTEQAVLDELAAEAELEAELAEESKSSPLFDGRYSFDLFRYHDDEDWQELGNGFVEIRNGIMTVAKEGRTLDTGSIDLYDSFEGQIDKKGNIMSSLKINVLIGKTHLFLVDLNGSIDSQLQGKWDHYYDVILKLGKKE